MFTKTLIAATLASIAVAAPLESRQNGGAFTLITTHSGNQNVHLRSVAANGGRFYIGKDTKTFCPEDFEGVDCSKTGNYTSFTAQPNTPTTLSLNVYVPGGQQAFVTVDGQLGFTPAHSHAFPEGADPTDFLYTPPTENTNGNLKFKNLDWNACPDAEAGVYQIYAAGAPGFVRTDCTFVDLVAFDYAKSTPAWEFE